jgi:hypothetical protein
MTIVYASADGCGTIARNGENTAAFIARTVESLEILSGDWSLERPVRAVAILMQHPLS